jgi:threonine dehydrogenase-like Zn-dependent dehydrogenase
MMGAGLIDNSRIITATFPLTQGVEAIKRATERRDGKIMILP